MRTRPSFCRRATYEDEDDKLNVDAAPLSELVEKAALILRSLFGIRSAGNYRWTGGLDNPEGDPNTTELFITESEHRIEEFIDKFPVLVISHSGGQFVGFDSSPASVNRPLTALVEESDLFSLTLVIKSCSAVGTEAIRLAEYASNYMRLFGREIGNYCVLHDVGRNISISAPTPSARIEGSTTRKWTEVSVLVPVQLEYGVSYEYSEGSAFRKARDRAIIAIENMLDGTFVISEPGE